MPRAAAPPEELVPFGEAPDLFLAVAGRRAPLKTCHRWRQVGLLVNGRRVRLGATKFGGRIFLTRAAVAAFLAATNADTAAPAEVLTPAKRKAEVVAAGKRALELLSDV